MEQALFEVSGNLASGFQTVATGVIDGVGTVAPIALTVMGAMLIWRVGARFFKSVAK